MEGNAQNSAITPTPHGTSEYVQHSITTHPTHGISGNRPLPNPTLISTAQTLTVTLFATGRLITDAGVVSCTI